MSHVTDTIFLLGACDDERMQHWLAIINPWLAAKGTGARRGLVSVDDPSIPAGWYGGSKALQCGVAVAAFNYLNIEEFLAFLSALPWESDEDYSVQVLMKDEHDEAFRLHTIFPHPNPNPTEES